ncbi:hypothetical protein [Calidifontibacter terrae]
MPGDFTTELRWCLATIPDANNRRMTTERMVALVNEAAAAAGDETRLSVSYANQLRQGLRSNPSGALVAAIARAFAIPVGFFFDDQLNAAIKAGAGRGIDAREAVVSDVQDRIRHLTPEQLATVVSLLDGFATARTPN